MKKAAQRRSKESTDFYKCLGTRAAVVAKSSRNTLLCDLTRVVAGHATRVEKCGVFLEDLHPAGQAEADLFASVGPRGIGCLGKMQLNHLFALASYETEAKGQSFL